MSLEKKLEENKSDMLEVLEHDSNTFSKGVKIKNKGIELSLTLNDTGKENEMYAVAEADDIDKAVEELEKLIPILSDEEKDVHTHSSGSWAEVRFRVNIEKVKEL